MYGPHASGAQDVPAGFQDSLTDATPGGSWLIFCVHTVDMTRS